jgi:hypothetical protein
MYEREYVYVSLSKTCSCVRSCATDPFFSLFFPPVLCVSLVVLQPSLDTRRASAMLVSYTNIFEAQNAVLNAVYMHIGFS